MDKATISLGDIAKHTITGFEGTVTGRTRWLQQCDRYTITPKSPKDGKAGKAHSFDETRLEFVREGQIKPLPAERGDADAGRLGQTRVTEARWQTGP